MKYDYKENIWIEVQLKQGDKNKLFISVSYSPQLLAEIKGFQKEIQDIYYANEKTIGKSLVLKNEERKRNYEMIMNRINTIFGDAKETYYIPAGRSLLNVMANNRAVMNNAVELDLITEMFMVLIDSVRNSFRDGVKKAHLLYPVEKRTFDIKNITDLIIHLEKGKYYYSGGREYLKMENSSQNSISINFASSGHQEVLWMLNFMYILMLRQENVFLIIEEPEAHIYPLLQKKIMEFITLFANIQDSGVLITTHSPYVLTATNNLYYAGVLAAEGQRCIIKADTHKSKSFVPVQVDLGNEIEVVQVDGGLISGLSEGEVICDNLIYTIKDKYNGLNITWIIELKGTKNQKEAKHAVEQIIKSIQYMQDGMEKNKEMFPKHWMLKH